MELFRHTETNHHKPFAQPSPILVGTAGWSVPTHLKSQFPTEGTHLEKYAQVFNCVEINSSFYRDHKPETYARWAQSVPAGFRFSVKLSRSFTQDARLEDTGPRLDETLQGISSLGEKWGCLLVQLPPSLDFKLNIATRFIEALREIYDGLLVWEPRHPSWVSTDALKLLKANDIQKVWADPEPCPLPPTKMKASRTLPSNYFRLHGSPQIYRSRYSPEALTHYCQMVEDAGQVHSQTWCIFDNTTYGFATENAREMMSQLHAQPQTASR